MTRVFPRDEHFMRVALREAAEAADHGDVPVGAVVVRDGEVVGAAHNEREARGDPTAHAEVLALRAAAVTLGGWRLLGTVLYCTLEPCPMCAGAIQQARVARVVFGAPDQKVGAAGSVINPLQDPRLLHRVEIQGGVLAAEALGLLRAFFDDRR
ncbi:tRNA adenosine(34) deaminase TadA [Miltoncostaea oceani]|uniref:tRNA adenosine(34) deaminase TadA n=1 Tax=Miltoncostaea oceani TaxID=2843216 RepID=UPI001C3D945D|nr:tRNA adenosine(34) deaminase TadA [Miltoncostaea oceani]